MKWALIIIITALFINNSNAQIINGKYYSPVKTPINWDFGRASKQFNIPSDTLTTADTSAIAWKNGKFYGKYRDGWKLLGADSIVVDDGGTSIVTGSAYTIVDGINNVLVRNTTGTTMLTLPIASVSNKREITIKNTGSYVVNTNIQFVLTAGSLSDVISPGSWVTIKSDGISWNVIQDNTLLPGSGGSVTGNEVSFVAIASQTDFTSPYALPSVAAMITVTRNGVILPFTKSGNTVTIIACDAGDIVKIKWID